METPRENPRGYAFLRLAKFAVASALGFLVAEAIIFVGVLYLFHTAQVPSLDYSSPEIIGLDALAFGTGVTAAFLINERHTVPGAGRDASWPARWGKYQLSSLLGNVLIVVVQLALLATVSLSPVFGSIVGAVVTYPVTYVVSMRFVWGISPLSSKATSGA